MGRVDRYEDGGCSGGRGRFAGVVVTSCALWLLLVCACCGSNHLAYFNAKPLRYCGSSKSIELSWFSDAKSVSVTATPPIPELSDSHQGPIKTLRIKPQATSIQLDFGPKDNRPVKQIAPLGPDDSSLMKGGFAAACVHDAVVAPFDFDADLYAPEVVVTAIQNPLGVGIVVEHAGGTWTIPAGGSVTLAADPGAPDDPSRHLPHTWTIRAPLPDGCAATTQRPNKLGVVMTLECLP
jgi:hypothetical protein